MAKTEKIVVNRIEIVDINFPKIKRDNARLHPERNIQDLMHSLARYGQQTPIVLNGAHGVLKGTGTLLAARALGWKKIAIVFSDLKGSEAEGYSIADNQTGLTSEWNFELLGQRLKVLIDKHGIPAADLGFLDHEIEPLLKANWTPPEVADLPGANGKPPAQTLTLAFEGQAIKTIQAAIEKAAADNGDEFMNNEAAMLLICQFYLHKTERRKR